MAEIFETSDIYFVAAAFTKGAELIGPLQVTDPRRIRFPLCGDRNGLDLDALYNQWLTGSLEGSLSDYASAIKNVKTMVHMQTDLGDGWIPHK